MAKQGANRTFKVGLVLIAVVAVLFVGAAWYFSSVLMFPGPFECTKEHFVYCGDPMEQGIPFEKIELKSSDGLMIRGWYMPAGNSTRAVVFAHGRGANRNEGMRFARPLHDAGYAVLAFDFRHCGESSRSFNSTGYHEKKDIIAAVDFLERKKGMKSIGLMGWSQGAATGIIAMAEDKRIRAGIFEAGFANAADAVAEAASRDFGLPRRPLLPFVMWLYSVRGRLDTDAMNAEDVIGSIAPRPVYIIHGDADTMVYYHHGERLFAAAGKPKQMWTVKGGPHVECWQMDRKRAEGSVKEFFKKYL
jgi:dipeptidyl aminopeptidase/acylaminoacyl peptidase